MRDIAIIGSGATATAAYLGLIDSEIDDYIITLFTPPRDDNSDQNPTDEPFVKMNTRFLRVNYNNDLESQLSNGMSGAPNFGGWTQFWGATILPWHKKVFEKIDRSERDYAEAYERIHEIVPLLASKDSLIDDFPLFGKPTTKHENTLTKVFTKKSTSGGPLVIGNSRLAVNGYGQNMGEGCTNCGLCLSGCPGDHIWNASGYFATDLPNLVIEESWVLSIENLEKETKVRIHYRDFSDEVAFQDFDDIFVAAGALSTAQLLIKSKIAEKIIIRDSPVTVVPFLSSNFRKLNVENGIALSSMFIAMNLDQSSEEHIFMQCYGMNDDLRRRVLFEKPVLRIVPMPFLRFILNRVGLAMVFQDMKYGGKIQISKLDEGRTRIFEKSQRSEIGRVKLRDALKQLIRHNLLPLWFLRHEGKPGEGFHFGASISQNMSRFPGEDQEIFKINAPNVHIVDSSVLPTIPCYPTTFTAMANAYLIAKSITPWNKSV